MAGEKLTGAAELRLTVDQHPSLGLQLSIESDGIGWRIKGPKYAGTSKRLLTADLSDSDLEELAWWIERAKSARAALSQGGRGDG